LIAAPHSRTDFIIETCPGGKMTNDREQVWDFVPHQHRGPAMHRGADDYIHSPRLHNGSFKARGLNTFMGAPYCEPMRDKIRAAGAKVCFLGVPHDHGNIVRCGTSQGPASIRDASTQYFPYLFEYGVDLFETLRPVDCGDVPHIASDNEGSHRLIYEYVTECLHGGALVILCGGDHSVPIPAARALSDYQLQIGGTLGYFHTDCHLDAGPDWEGNPITNCSGPPRALDLPNFKAENMAHMGSRNGLNPKDWVDFYVDNEIRVMPMREIVYRGIEPCAHEIFKRLWDGTSGVYWSWDTDSLDASGAPGTTAPEPFGLKSREAIELARIGGTYGANVLEISELCPIWDSNGITSKLACCLVYHFLGARAVALAQAGTR
jgi:agmatinase